MDKIVKPFCLGAMLLAGVSAPAVAADLYEPQVVEAPAPVQAAPVATGGWYIRGDVDYHWSDFRGADYITYGPPPGTNTINNGKLDGAWSVGGGVGYKINSYLRTDVTADYLFKSGFSGNTVGSSCGGAGPCHSDERGGYSGWLLLANAYADLGTYHGITPYVGAGIGGAHIKWDDLHDPNTTERNGGTSSWRFAYALMAGASYCLTHNVSLDVGYRFTHINGGRMFEYAPVAGPGFDRGMNVNEVRAGLRYSFGGNSGDGCEEPQVAYQPPAPEPVYK
ncbi:MAG: porin family protein [Rhizobiaceae bacterium]|nr:MAG: porin family protein [Rhizobiaceae bacterium]